GMDRSQGGARESLPINSIGLRQCGHSMACGVVAGLGSLLGCSLAPSCWRIESSLAFDLG
ncbi:hypothetical protein MLD52_23300, partial [Puniceicoccaceae bacterium K14]|nr:hypothetical protein [Puniceicoccaceae bacterium K14]